LSKIYRRKSGGLDRFLTATIYVCAAVCITLGGVLLIRHFRGGDDISVETIAYTEPASVLTAVTTTAATTIITETEAVTTAATEIPEAESETGIKSETEAATAAETKAAFAAPTQSQLGYDKEFFADFLFIGDSISTGLSGYNFLPAENVFAKQGFTPNNIPGKELSNLTVTEKAAEMTPDTIVIMLGTNGLSYIDTGVMTKAYGELIDSIQAASPDSKIVILSIPPVTAAREASKPENLTIINEYNGKIKTLADDKGAVYIDINSLLADENGHTADIYAENDGLHLKGEAYKRILSAIQDTLSENETE
jgi:lysophospholipase L1-like esterase